MAGAYSHPTLIARAKRLVRQGTDAVQPGGCRSLSPAVNPLGEGADQTVVYVRAMAERWTAQWKELYAEVVTTGLVQAVCVRRDVPHDVIGYEHEEGLPAVPPSRRSSGLDNCIHGEKGCTTCTRACPRFRAWEPSADMHLFGRVREPDEMYGIWRELLLTRASDEMVHKMGQDGGLVGAMLIWLREHDYIDAALVSGVEDDDRWKAKPVIVSTQEEILATAGWRYTYCANPLALRDAKAAGPRPAGAGRDGLPDVGTADDVGPQGGQGVARRSCSTSGCCARRPSTTPSSTSCSRPSTACPSRTW